MAVQAALPLVQRSASISSADSVNQTRSFLTSIYSKFKSHYEWFRRTQRGQISGVKGRAARNSEEAWRWRGQSLNPDQLLTSGLDDHPRAEPPTKSDLHVDLICWMATFAKTMEELADACGEVEDRAKFAKEFEAVKGNINDLHWSEEHQLYLNATVNSQKTSQFVVVRGYVCLFPLLLSLISIDSPKLGATLEFMRDPRHMWCDYGLRSLAQGEKYYGKDEDYWKGPIWIPICYMALKALHGACAKTLGPYQARTQEIYIELRQNLIKNMYREYKRTGFVFEQYNDKT